MKGQFFKNLDFAGYSLQSDNHKDETTNIGPQNTELKKNKNKNSKSYAKMT